MQDIEGCFDTLSRQAWNTVLLQLFKIYVLQKVTPKALTGAPAMPAQQPPAPAAQPSSAAIAGEASQASSRQSARASSAESAARAPAASSSGSSTSGGNLLGREATPAPAPPPPGQMLLPGDDVLASSNVYGVSEACLMAWLNVHMQARFPGVSCARRGCPPPGRPPAAACPQQSMPWVHAAVLVFPTDRPLPAAHPER